MKINEKFIAVANLCLGFSGIINMYIFFFYFSLITFQSVYYWLSFLYLIIVTPYTLWFIEEDEKEREQQTLNNPDVKYWSEKIRERNI